jgi:hypothetical protein
MAAEAAPNGFSRANLPSIKMQESRRIPAVFCIRIPQT